MYYIVEPHKVYLGYKQMMTCLIVTCELRTINLSITGERITFTMEPVSLKSVTV